MMEEDNWLQQGVFWPLHGSYDTHAHKHTINKCNLIWKKKGEIDGIVRRVDQCDLGILWAADCLLNLGSDSAQGPIFLDNYTSKAKGWEMIYISKKQKKNLQLQIFQRENTKNFLKGKLEEYLRGIVSHEKQKAWRAVNLK